MLVGAAVAWRFLLSVPIFFALRGQRRQNRPQSRPQSLRYPESHRVSFPCDNSSRVARCRNHNTVVICHITGREYENEAKDGKPDEQSVRYDAHLTFYAERSTICWAGRRRDGCPAAGVPLAGVGSGGLFGESLWLLMKSKGKH